MSIKFGHHFVFVMVILPKSSILLNSSVLKTGPSIHTRWPLQSHWPHTPKPHFMYLSRETSHSILCSLHNSTTLYNILSGPQAYTFWKRCFLSKSLSKSTVVPLNPTVPSSVHNFISLKRF